MPLKQRLLFVGQVALDVIKTEIDQLLTVDHGAFSVMSAFRWPRPGEVPRIIRPNHGRPATGKSSLRARQTLLSFAGSWSLTTAPSCRRCCARGGRRDDRAPNPDPGRAAAPATPRPGG